MPDQVHPLYVDWSSEAMHRYPFRLCGLCLYCSEEKNESGPGSPNNGLVLELQNFSCRVPASAAQEMKFLGK